MNLFPHGEVAFGAWGVGRDLAVPSKTRLKRVLLGGIIGPAGLYFSRIIGP